MRILANRPPADHPVSPPGVPAIIDIVANRPSPPTMPSPAGVTVGMGWYEGRHDSR
jgi:hypothetical protein